MNILTISKICILSLLTLSFLTFAQSAKSTITSLEVHGILWDQHEMTIGEVKRYAAAVMGASAFAVSRVFLVGSRFAQTV